MRIRITVALVLVGLVAAAALSAQQASDVLMIYGNNLLFGVKEPAGWTGDTKNASRIPANVVFYPKTQSWPRVDPMVYIQVTSQRDEDTAGDIAADQADYRKRYPGIVFKELAAPHPQYSSAASEFYVAGKFAEYVVYVSPGKTKPLKFAVILNVQKREATDDELNAFRKIVSSLNLITP